MTENTSTRRNVLKTTGTLAASGSLFATAGCLGGGGSGAGSEPEPDLDGEVTTEGPAENVSADTSATATESGYALEITLTNDSESSIEAAAEAVWTDDAGETVEVTGTEANRVDAGAEGVLETDVDDSEDTITGYSVTVVAAPA